jgi:hypothetical protein
MDEASVVHVESTYEKTPMRVRLRRAKLRECTRFPSILNDRGFRWNRRREHNLTMLNDDRTLMSLRSFNP